MIMAGALAVLLLAPTVGATPVSHYFATSGAASQAQAGVNAVGGTTGVALPTALTTIVNTLLFIVGLIAVLVIIVGGIQYILAAGDTSKITKAKDTILYAVVGLVVALLAFSIVNFVVTKF